MSEAPASDAIVAPVTKDVMSTSTIVAPVTEAAPAAIIEPAPEPAATDDKPKVVPKWFNDRFSEMTTKNKTLESTNQSLIDQNAQLLIQLAAAKKPVDPASPPVVVTSTVTPAPQDIDKLVNARAEQIAAAKKFNEECDNIAAQGNKEFSDFPDALTVLHQVGLIEPPDKPQTFLDVATTLTNPHKVIHFLGTNPDEAARLRALPPIRMAAELARLEIRINQPKAVSISNAPPPIKPINGSAKSDVDLMNAKDMPMDQWVEARRKQRQAKRDSRN